MPHLYSFLWNNNSDYFDAANNYWWAKSPEEVLYVCSEYFKYLVFLEEEHARYLEDLKEYEVALK